MELSSGQSHYRVFAGTETKVGRGPVDVPSEANLYVGMREIGTEKRVLKYERRIVSTLLNVEVDLKGDSLSDTAANRAGPPASWKLKFRWQSDGQFKVVEEVGRFAD